MKKLIPKDKQKLVYIRWQDAHHNGSWMTPSNLEEEVNREMLICENIGWVVYEDEKEIHIVSRRSNWIVDTADSYGLYQRIPKAWIRKKKVMVK